MQTAARAGIAVAWNDDPIGLSLGRSLVLLVPPALPTLQPPRRGVAFWRYARSGVGQCARIVEYADLGVEADGAEANRRPADHVERATCGVGMVVAAIARMFDRVLSRAMGLPLKGA